MPFQCSEFTFEKHTAFLQDPDIKNFTQKKLNEQIELIQKEHDRMEEEHAMMLKDHQRMEAEHNRMTPGSEGK